MTKLVKELKNSKKVVFETGSFDEWCVYIVNKSNKNALTDAQCFTFLKTMASTYTAEKVYNDFVKIYDNTGSDIDTEALVIIDSIVETYKPNDRNDVEEFFTFLYAAMISEENKENTKLGKRIKRLGVYQAIMENFTANDAANFSKGKKWKELDKIMQEKGF